jgi:hypothetical protein
LILVGATSICTGQRWKFNPMANLTTNVLFSRTNLGGLMYYSINI